MKTVKLGDVCEKITDGSHFSPKSDADGLYPYVTVRDINNDAINFEDCKRISKKQYCELEKNGCKPEQDDLLFSKDGTVGKVTLVNFDKEFVVLSSLAIIRPNQEAIVPRYLFHILKSNSFLADAIGKKSGAAIRRIILRDLKNITIRIHDTLEEQWRVVKRLDAAFEKIDRAIELTETNIVNSRSLFDNHVHRIIAESNWSTVKLPDIARYFNGLTYKPSEVDEKGTIVLRSSNIQNDELAFEDLIRVSSTIKEKLYVEKGDILMCSRNGSKRLIGKTAVIENIAEPMTFGTFMMIIRGDMNPYLTWFFKSRLFRSQLFRGEATQINQITRYILDSVSVPVPPSNKVDTVVNSLSRSFVSSRRLEESYKIRLRYLGELKQSLLTQAFSHGEVE